MLQFKQISMRIGLVAALILVLLAMMVLNTYPVNARPDPMNADQPIQATDEEDEDGLDLGGDEDEDEDTDQQDEEDEEDEDEDEDEPEVPDLEDIDLLDDPDDVIDALREGDFLSTKRDGKLLVTFPPNGATFGKTAAPGWNYLSLGGRKTAENLVLFSTIEWPEASKNGMCGLGFRTNSKGGYINGVFVLLGNNGLIYASVEEDNDVVDKIEIQDDDQDFFDPEEVNALVVIADSEEVKLFVNSKYVGTLEGPEEPGGFNIWVYNESGNKKITHCIFRQGWVWTFDS